ncbi:MAG: metallophosphoesterase [Micavibrio sp.]|nr:metallophosphoesterase [Micavibrio sp.]
MTKIIHISDLHFGTTKDMTIKLLQQKIKEMQPDLVVISGDFTQVSSKDEFRIAQQFLQDIGVPFFAVPGNHDVPPYNLYKRFFEPYKRYKHYISEILNPTLETEDFALAGINSARKFLLHWNWANGAINAKQREKVKEFYQNTSRHKWRICIFHHPIHKVDEMPIDVAVFGKDETLRLMHEMKVDLVLTGHVHHASINMRGDNHHQTVYLSASTALSSRTRGQQNGFNEIILNDEDIQIKCHALCSDTFEELSSYTHKRQKAQTAKDCA